MNAEGAICGEEVGFLEEREGGWCAGALFWLGCFDFGV